MSRTPARTLLLMRHAKSDRPAGVDDVERPLAGRGRRDARAAGRVLGGSRAWAAGPKLVLCSPALRTRQTWQLVREGLGDPPQPRFVPALYGADPGDLLALLRAVPAETATVLVIGHEPTLSLTAEGLAGKGSSRPALDRLALKFPTSGIATLTVPAPWADLAPAGAVLTDFTVPRG